MRKPIPLVIKFFRLQEVFYLKDTERRLFLIENGYFDRYIEKRRTAFNNGLYVFDGKNYDTEYFEMTQNDCWICERIRKSCKEQREKVENHINFLFNKNHYDLFFVTFTFSDETLFKTKKETRKQKIRRLLSNLEDYILNIDYGKNTEREHYHSIIAIKKGTYEKTIQNGHLKLSCIDKYNFGNYDIKEINTSNLDSKKLSRYITKLTLHSVKVKQNYISVKKGSDFQKWKKTIDQIKTNVRFGKERYLEELYDEMTSLEY